MTIKRRLFISNILMIIIPLMLSLTVSGVMLHVFMEIYGYDEHSTDTRNNDSVFYEASERIDWLSEKWSQNNTQLAEMKEDVKVVNDYYRDFSVFLAIYQDKMLIYPSSFSADKEVLDNALTQQKSHMFEVNNVAVYWKGLGEYTIILTAPGVEITDWDSNLDSPPSFINEELIILGLVLVIILFTNRFLTHYVFNSIAKPLDSLVYGVHQIRDGNLDYHIDYAGKDEFAGVCADFNEMAKRLLRSVENKQKDEANRRELIAGISHDLRTPLTSIKAYVEGIEKGVASTPEMQKHYLDTIKNKTGDMEHIVNQLFQFSKLDIGEFPLYLEKIDIGQELSAFLAVVTEEYGEKGLHIITQNIQNVYVRADRVQLRNAFTNILENSVKYRNKDICEVIISCQADDEDVTISLADDGPGVSDQALAKLFDVFYRSDPSRNNPSRGSGLGLAITAKIIERLGGTIRAENLMEGGLAMVINLPVYLEGVDKGERNTNC